MTKIEIEIEKNKGWHSLLFIFIGILLVLTTVLSTVMIYNCLRYEKVYLNPIIVQGTITEYSEYEDSEGDTTYYAHITYTVDGKEYTIKYDSYGSESKLPALGTTYTISVNPNNHSELMNNITNSKYIIFILPFFIAGIIIIVCILGREKLLQKNKDNYEDRIKRDIKAVILTRRSDKIFTILAIGAAALYLRFPFVFSKAIIITAAVFLLIAGIFIFRNIRCLNLIKNDEYTIVKSTLYNKRIQSSEDSDTYYLHYRDTENEWKCIVSQNKYDTAVIGTNVKTVYLNRIKNPIISYDTDGTIRV